MSSFLSHNGDIGLYSGAEFNMDSIRPPSGFNIMLGDQLVIPF